MSKIKKGIGIVIIFLGAVGGIMLLGQKENLQAVYEGMHYDQEELTQQIQSTKEEVDKVLEKYDLQPIRRLTPEEEVQVKTGVMSVEEAVERMMPARSKEVLASEDKADAEPQVAPPKENDIVQSYTAKMYTLQAKYTGLLGGLESSAIQAIKAIPSDKRTVQKMLDMGMPFVQQGLALESQCDGEVEGLLHDLKEELVVLKADYGIVETMRQAYYTEKRLKKAYYFSLIPK